MKPSKWVVSAAMFNRFKEVREWARKETVCSFYFPWKRILILIDKTMCYFCIWKGWVDCGLRMASWNNHRSCLVWTAQERTWNSQRGSSNVKNNNPKLFITKIISEIDIALNSPWNSMGRFQGKRGTSSSKDLRETVLFFLQVRSTMYM